MITFSYSHEANNKLITLIAIVRDSHSHTNTVVNIRVTPLVYSPP